MLQKQEDKKITVEIKNDITKEEDGMEIESAGDWAKKDAGAQDIVKGDHIHMITDSRKKYLLYEK